MAERLFKKKQTTSLPGRTKNVQLVELKKNREIKNAYFTDGNLQLLTNVLNSDLGNIGEYRLILKYDGRLYAKNLKPMEYKGEYWHTLHNLDSQNARGSFTGKDEYQRVCLGNSNKKIEKLISDENFYEATILALEIMKTKDSNDGSTKVKSWKSLLEDDVKKFEELNPKSAFTGGGGFRISSFLPLLLVFMWMMIFIFPILLKALKEGG